MSEITSTLEDFGSDPEGRVLIITGRGDRAFSAGIDLQESAEQKGVWASGRRHNRGRAMFEAVIETWKPVILFVLLTGLQLELVVR